MVQLDPSVEKPRTIYDLMIGGIVPRPIAWISTQSQNGIRNLAPFSFYNGVSSHPPCLMVSITSRPDGKPKDTLRNILETKQFVVNSSSVKDAQMINLTSTPYDFEVDEIEIAQLSTLPSVKIKPPRLANCMMHFECQLLQKVQIGKNGPGSAMIVIGEILMIHVNPKILQNGKIDTKTYDPLSRLGGQDFGKTSGIFHLPRPKNEPPKKENL